MFSSCYVHQIVYSLTFVHLSLLLNVLQWHLVTIIWTGLHHQLIQTYLPFIFTHIHSHSVTVESSYTTGVNVGSNGLIFSQYENMGLDQSVVEPGVGTGWNRTKMYWGTESEPRTKVIYTVPEQNHYFKMNGNWIITLIYVPGHAKPMQSSHYITQKCIPVSACQLKIFVSVCSCVGYLALPIRSIGFCSLLTLEAGFRNEGERFLIREEWVIYFNAS